MLGTPPLDGHVDDRHVDGSEDREDGTEGSGLAAGGEAAENQIADVEEPEKEFGGEACIPGPPNAPCRLTPEHSSGEAYACIDYGNFGRCYRQCVGGKGLEGIATSPEEISERGDEVDIGKDETQNRVGKMIV